MNTYLSVDMDYWFRDDNEDFEPMFNFFESIKHINNKILVASHEDMLPHINEVDPDHILHVDFHQDICFPITKNHWRSGRCYPLYKVEFHCGSFFYFVEGRETKTFKWFYPDYHACIKREMGLCMSLEYRPFSKNNFIFEDQTRKLGMPTKAELEAVTAVGIAVSRDYCYPYTRFNKPAIKAMRLFYDWFGREQTIAALTQENTPYK